MRPTYLRRRAAVMGVLLVVVVTAVLLSRSGPAAHPGAHAAAPSPVPDTHPSSTSGTATSTTTTLPGLRGLTVTQSVLPLVDASRPVTSDGVVLSAVRHLTTQVWAPVGPGPFPLVVFAAGYDKGPLDYARFCATLASSGYVVAAPSFPLEDPAQGYALNRGELPAEAGDVAFVASRLEQDAATFHLLAGRVGVVGHSDGADVALLIGYASGTQDSQVTSVVADAPDPMSGPTATSSVPLLLVQGTSDSVVPYAASQTVFTQVDAPVIYLSLIGADHFPPIAGGTAWTPVLDEAVAGFLDATLADRGPGLTALTAQLSTSPLARVLTKA